MSQESSIQRRDAKEGTQAILLWSYFQAPEQYRELSGNGGDEDWVAFVPEGVDPPYWMADVGFSSGICEVEEHQVDGGTVYIGSHA